MISQRLTLVSSAKLQQDRVARKGRVSHLARVAPNRNLRAARVS
jgi:hypothetical protein